MDGHVFYFFFVSFGDGLVFLHMLLHVSHKIIQGCFSVIADVAWRVLSRDGFVRRFFRSWRILALKLWLCRLGRFLFFLFFFLTLGLSDGSRLLTSLISGLGCSLVFGISISTG